MMGWVDSQSHRRAQKASAEKHEQKKRFVIHTADELSTFGQPMRCCGEKWPATYV